MRDFNRQFHYLDEEGLPVIRGIGRGQGGVSYDWDARQRKEKLVVLQVTLKGGGYLETNHATDELSAGKAFLATIPGPFRYYGENWHFLFVEFSPMVQQWLDPFQVLTLSGTFCENLGYQLAAMNQNDVDLYQNAQLAFQLLLSLKKESNEQRLQQNPLMIQVKNYLESACHRDLSLDEVAETFQLSKFSLIRQFEATYQQTPMKYLQMYRINQSLPLLWSGNAITHVAQQVGFTNANYFSKVFKRQMGMTPKDYQQKQHLY